MMHATIVMDMTCVDDLGCDAMRLFERRQFYVRTLFMMITFYGVMIDEVMMMV